VSRWGTFAQRVVVPAESLAPVPEGWSDQEAGGASLVYLTAYQALSMWGELTDAIVLVSGASGGVGVASIHLARAMGHKVVALSRSEEKRRRLTELGAFAVFDPGNKQWRRELKQLLAPRRVDLAIDNIGGALFPEMIDTLGDHGKVSCVGRLAGPVPQFNTGSLFFRRIRIGGVAVGTYGAAEGRTVWDKVVALLGRIGARPLVDSVFPFEQLPAAFARLSGDSMGKVLVAMNS
jgi:NADPH:quinone reductase